MGMEREEMLFMEVPKALAKQRKSETEITGKLLRTLDKNSEQIINTSMEDEFTHGQIHIKCPYPLQEVSELAITEAMNQHGVLELKGILKEEQEDDFVEHACVKDVIEVYGDNSHGESLLFSGRVTELSVQHINQVYYVEIKAMTSTCLMDFEEKKRSFQDKGMSYSALIKQVMSTYAGGNFINVTEHASLNKFVLQYKETDWNFIKRLASHFNTFLVADHFSKEPRFSFGIIKKKRTIRHAERITISVDSDSYEQAKRTGLFLRKIDFTKYTFHSQDRFTIGERVSFQDHMCIVEQTKYYIEAGVMYYEYVVGHEEGVVLPLQHNQNIHGISLLGEVLASKNQTVKLKLNIDKAQDEKKAQWFPYAAQANNVFYCMPEKGTSISLYFSNADENSAMAVNAVRKNGGSCAKMSNPNLKYMGTPEGKEFKLGETDIDFATIENSLFMKMDVDKGVQVETPEDMNIFAKQKLLMEAKEMIQVLANSGDISVTTGDESALFLLGGVGGDSNILPSSMLYYDGRSREVFQPLNEAIEFKKKPKFSWLKLAGCVLAGMAVVAAVVVTAGAAAAVLGATAAVSSGAMFGAAISGTIAVVGKAIGDIASGENSSLIDYVTEAFKASVEGGICGAIGGAVFESMSTFSALADDGLSAMRSFLGKCVINGTTSLVTDTYSQLSDMILNGKPFSWKRSVESVLLALLSTGAARSINELTKNINLPQSLRTILSMIGGDPVNLVTGAMMFNEVDFELPGPIPLKWERNWQSDSGVIGHLGHGTRLSFEMGMDVFEDEGVVIVYLSDGRVVSFPYLLDGETYFSFQEKLLFKREKEKYSLFDPESRYHYILSPVENGYMQYQLTKICTLQGHKIALEYNEKGYLSKIVDSANRELSVITNVAGRINQVFIKNGTEYKLLVQYAYNNEQDLIGVMDANGQNIRMEYRNHLMLNKVDRNGNAFHWQYERAEVGARVTRTWGDDNILLLYLTYHDDEFYNEVIDSKGNATLYHYDERKLCTRIQYADKTEIRRKYNDRFELVSEIDEEGRLTSYAYDDWSQETKIVYPDAGSVLFDYDKEGRCISTTAPEGGRFSYSYNVDDTLRKSIDPMGQVTKYIYNENHLLEQVINAKEDVICLTYDKDFNVDRIILPDGTSSTWVYDYRGNCLSSVNPLGAIESYEYDALDRIIKASLPDGNVVHLTYNAYNDILRAKDKYSDVSFTYTILGSPETRTQSGRKISYQYNKEEQLTAVINEMGEVYHFERNIKGDIIKKTCFDGSEYLFERDQSGLIKKINRPGDRWTNFKHDKVGRIINASYYDGTSETFSYNLNGELLEAKNEHSTVKFKYNSVGQVVEEDCNGHKIKSTFDMLGNRIGVNSSLGANIAFAYDKIGNITHMAASQTGQTAWAARMNYNEFGQEMERLLPGQIMSKWQYDSSGRPIHHQVDRNFQKTRQNSYIWDLSYHLKSVQNEMTKEQRVFGYDEFHNLAWSRRANFEFMYKSLDEVGNLFETKAKTDRIYEKGSRLKYVNVDTKELNNKFQGGFGKLINKGTELFYDEEGNLTKKVASDGKIWQFEYSGNGMLSKIITHRRSGVYRNKSQSNIIDIKETTFKYDPLGRRIEKCCDGKLIKFVWDGNALIHEWVEEIALEFQSEQESLHNQFYKCAETKKKNAIRWDISPTKRDSFVTWVFQDEFIPSVKITKNGKYSIICDYLGTPVEAYDEEGKKVWSVELDIYGKAKKTIGEKNFVPFRYQGQYDDDETGLYYNRMRYYEPVLGQYTQPDPMGLRGNNPTLYAYVNDVNSNVDVFGMNCHHIATNKHKIWSDRFRELFKQNGLGKFKNGKFRKDVLNDPLNKVIVPGHKGPHPEEMHLEIMRRLQAASDLGPEQFKKTLQALGKEAKTAGTWLNNILLKK